MTRPALWQHHWLWTGWSPFKLLGLWTNIFLCTLTCRCPTSTQTFLWVSFPSGGSLLFTLGLCELEHQLIKVSFIVKNNMYIKSQILGVASHELQSGSFMAWTRSEPTTRCWYLCVRKAWRYYTRAQVCELAARHEMNQTVQSCTFFLCLLLLRPPPTHLTNEWRGLLWRT